MNNPPVCPECGESVADYKGPCPKPAMTARTPDAVEERIAEIEARLIGTSEPPWRCKNKVGYVYSESDNCVVATCGNFLDKELTPFNSDRWNADARLIANARQDIPWLVGAYRAAMAEIEKRKVEGLGDHSKDSSSIGPA